MKNLFFLNNASYRKIKEIFGMAGEIRANDRQAVMMAIDGVYRNGRHIENESDFMISNDHVMKLKGMNRKIIFGASVHPYRGHREVLVEVRRCLNAGAAFFSWIPSIQKIDLEDERCIPFYVCLATEGIPLVCYVGSGNRPGNNREGPEIYRNPKKLTTALDVGLNVVLANYTMLCNADPLPQEEKILFEELLEMLRLSAEKEWNLYADISPYCRQGMTDFQERIETCVRNGEINPRQLVYGCSFPVFLDEKHNLKKTQLFGEYISINSNRDITEKELKKILIVDDEKMILKLMTEILSGDGREVITCENLKEAQEAFSKHKFALVITDLRLSGKDSVEGFEVISKAKIVSPDTKVMLMTGNRQFGIREEALRRGAVCCIDKPFDILDMARKVESFGIPLPQILTKGQF